MALDLIKQYLVGIGFNVNSESLENAKQSMTKVEDKIGKFNDNSNKGFSKTNDSMKSLFSLINSSGSTLGKMFPEMQGPFKNLIKDICLVKKLYNDLSKEKITTKVELSKEKDKSINKNKNPFKDKKENRINNKDDTKNKEEIIVNRKYNLKTDDKNIINSKKILKDFESDAADNFKVVENSAASLSKNGGKSILNFSNVSASSIAIVLASMVALVVSTKKVISYLGDLAQQDIKFEKLSRQLWTTKENAKEVDMALSTLGADLNDLWISPTMLNQFNQLRKDSKDLKLPKEYNDNLKVIQGISLEFKRLKQLGTLAFQWIGNYILKYCAGPLSKIKSGVHEFNDWLVEHIPQIGKVVGTVIGVLARILLIIGKIISIIWKLTSPIRAVFGLIGKLFGAFEKAPEPIKKAIKIIIGLILLITNPILIVIGIIDDLFSYFRGGKSLIGSFIDKIVEKAKGAGKVIKGIITTIKAILTGGLSLLPWDKYWEKAKETFEKIKNKAKETWEKVKEWAGDKMESAKDFVSNASSKVKDFVKGEDKVNTSASYVTSNNTSSSSVETKNSNNKVSNSNIINVYGNEAKSTANAVNKNLTGITTRSLQGVY
ncbi:YtxH domain-containing protein [Clostridium botulinum]|uniref:YtxH domain-containing protein n=1 Tax=Clostridium botulinum TaxID=1491 RepID=UPI0007732ED4|nr:YtxH domain-containing protein [Clostridium botulinum]